MGIPPPGGTIWNGAYYISPYYVTDLANGGLLTLFCLDFNHGINPPPQWDANLSVLASSNLGQFQYGSSPDAYNHYLEAAWLFSNMIGAEAQSDTNDAMVSQVAAWSLFVDAAHVNDLTTHIGATSGTFNFTDYVGMNYQVTQLTFSDAVNAALTASQNAVVGGGWTADGWTVVTGDPQSNGGPVQEFLTPVPEPASLLCIGTFLLAAWVVSSKRLRRS